MSAVLRCVHASYAAVLLSALTLAVPSPASAAHGAWSDEAGIQHLHFETAPISVRPGQNTVDNVIVPPSAKPAVDGYIIRMKPDLRYLNGRVPPVDVIHLHHGVWINANGHSDNPSIGNLEPIFFGGEEKTVFHIPKGYGYPYKASDTWVLDQMIHNNTPAPTKVKLVWDLDFIPATAPLAQTVSPVKPLWMSVSNKTYPVFDTFRGSGGKDGRFTFPDDEKRSPYPAGTKPNEQVMPYGGTIVSAIGHLHPGGLYDDIDVVRPGASVPTGSACRTVALDPEGTTSTDRCVSATKAPGPNAVRVFRSEAKYYDKAGPVSWDTSLTASRPDWRVQVNAGDTVRISSTYESRLSSWYENMGIVLLYVAPDDTTGLDPFAEPVDPEGVLTHGHLAENDNHGGGRSTLADATKVASGRIARTVTIRNYQFMPGDLGLLNAGQKVPTIRQGQSLQFVNKDDPAYEWHSITTCAAPCNRTIGISYPLANGQNGVQFDSGQLGFGPALSPARNTISWRTPANLRPATYTYFCRVHNFMRGSFRVVKRSR